MNLPKAIEEQSCLFYKKGKIITIECETYEEAEEVLEWIENA